MVGLNKMGTRKYRVRISSKSVHMAVYLHRIILALVLIAWIPSMALALTASQVYEQVKESVVVVKAYDRQGKPVRQGSGVMLPSGEAIGDPFYHINHREIPCGDIITNHHIVKAGVRYTVARGRQIIPATMKVVDPEKDLCLLSAPGLIAKPAVIKPFSRRPKVGERVYAVGAPQGLELSLSEGIVSQLRGFAPIIQTTVAISPGSSGGGLFNTNGELVGITTFYLKSGQSLNFALPVNWVIAIAQVAYYQDSVRLNPNNHEAWFLLGMAYGTLDHHKNAIKAYRESLRLKPNDASIWILLAGSFSCLGQCSEAIKAYSKALRLDPNNTLNWASFSDLYYTLNYSSERVTYMETLKGLRQYNPQEAQKIFNRINKP